MKKIVVFVIAILVTGAGYAQKRNLISNSRFEDDYKNWRRYAPATVQFLVETATPIAGLKSARVEIGERLTNTWDARMSYYHPVTMGVRYEIRFKVRATGTDSIFVEFCQNHDAFTAMFRGWCKVAATTHEVVLTTTAASVSDWNNVLSFHFGQQNAGTKVWLDDVSLTQIDGNWDGNLLPNGDLDHGLAPFFDWNAGSLCTINVDNTNQMNGNSLYIKKNSMGDNTFWGSNLGWWCYWANEGVYHEFSFKGKAKTGSVLGKLDIRSNQEPFNGADPYVNDFDITETTQTFVLNKNNNFGMADPVSSAYTATWGGEYKFFGGLNLAQTPAGFEVYLDDIAMKEVVTLLGIQVEGSASATLLRDTSYRVWANPTHADNGVTWSVVNKTGEGTIDVNGKFTPTKVGEVYVKAVSTLNTSLKDSLLVTITENVGTRNLISNARFEDDYKNWRRYGPATVQYLIESAAPIAGFKSARIEIGENLANTWDARMSYYHPVVQGSRYEVRFKVKATGTNSIFVEFCQNHDAFTPLFRGSYSVGTTAKEIVITTTAASVSDWNHVLSFHFGQQNVGTKIWIDDVAITQLDGNWDGNLLPNGDLDHGLVPFFDWNAGSLCTINVDNTNQIHGNSLYIKKNTMGDNSFWGSNLGWWCYWANEGVYHEFSFKGKAKAGSALGKLDIRTNQEPFNGADPYVNDFDITETTQTFVLNKDNNFGKADPVTDPYTATWGGEYKFFGSLNLAQTPAGFEVYLDDITMKELVTLNGISIDGPLIVKADTIFRVWANPTHADNSAFWSVTNGSGYATIDINGNFHPLKAGTVTINAVSRVNNALTASKTITISFETSLNVDFSDIKRSSLKVNWINGAGNARVVFRSQSTSGSAVPANNTTYIVGSQIGTSGWYCVYNGTGNTCDVTGLTPNTTYRFHVIEYTSSAPGTEQYQVTANVANVTTGTAYLNQSITFDPVAPVDYGTAPFALTGTSTSLLPVIYNSSNPKVAVVNGSTITIVGGGVTTITASQPGNSDFNAATSVSQDLMVNKVRLWVTVDNLTRMVGEDNPTFHLVYKGFVGTDDALVLETAPVVTCNVYKKSPSGTYYITISGGKSDRYEFEYDNSKTLTVLSTGVAALYGSEKFRIYPIPVSDVFTIESAEGETGVSVALFSSTGLLLRSLKTTESSTCIDIREFAAGIYWVKITGADKVMVKQILKK